MQGLINTESIRKEAKNMRKGSTDPKKNRFFNKVEKHVRAVCEDKTDEVMKKAFEGYKKIVNENIDEPEIMYPHTRERIYPAIAIFYALLDFGLSREESSKLILDYYIYMSKKGGSVLRGLLKIPGLYKKVPSIAYKAIEKSYGEDAGFKAEFLITTKDELKVDMFVCPYFEICKKYGCPEIVNAFCTSDDIAYGNMHKNLKWHREQTLGRGGDRCDFNIKIEKNNK